MSFFKALKINILSKKDKFSFKTSNFCFGSTERVTIFVLSMNDTHTKTHSMNSSNFSPAELTKQRIKANNEAQKKANIAYYAQRVQYAKNFSPHKLNYYIALYNEALQLDKK